MVLFVAVLAPGDASSSPAFEDVVAGSYYEDAVAWLAETGITTGTSDTTFSPDAFVTRGQMAAFLARFGEYAEDSPASGFSDVVADSFYEEAVDWLVEHEITTGTSATTFSPDDFVTRSQMAAFLWRFAGRIPSGQALPFSDVEPGTWYTDAVAWLFENAITTGTSDTTFSPDAFVTRAQMATFLWRLAGSPDADQPGANRSAAAPVSGDGGSVSSGGVEVGLDGLTGDGYVKVLIGVDDGLAALTGEVSEVVEIVIAQAELDGPVEVTVPIDDVDTDAFDLIVNVVGNDGDWVELTVTVTTSVVGGQMYATFSLPADVPLAPTVLTVQPLSLSSAGGGHQRIVMQVTASAVAPPTTAAPTTTTVAPDAPIIDASALEGSFTAGIPAGGYVTAVGGSGIYVDFRTSGLPSGMELIVQSLDPFVAQISGAPAASGDFAAVISLEDDVGAVGVAYVLVSVAPNGIEGEFEVIEPADSRYPSVSPNGRYVNYFENGSIHTVDLDTDTVISQTSGSLSGGGWTSTHVDDAGEHLVHTWWDGVVHRDIDAGTQAQISTSGGRSAVSRDVRFVAITSSEPGLTPEVDLDDSYEDVFLWDREGETFTRVTNGVGFESVVIDISADGRYVLISSGDITGLGGAAANGGLWLWDRDTDSFTFIDEPDLVSPFTLNVTLSGDGSTVYYTAAEPAPQGSAIHRWDRDTEAITEVTGVAATRLTFGWFHSSDDGRHLTFRTRTDLLDPSDSNGLEDLYTWDANTSTMTRVTAGAGLAFNPYGGFAVDAASSVVVFLSPDPTLDGTDNNAWAPDVFTWTRGTGQIERVTSGTESVSNPVLISENGATVLFSRTNVLAWRRLN